MNRDGALGRDDLNGVPILHRHRRFGERRDEVADVLVEVDFAVLDQHHDRRAGDRLGLRRETEDGVHGHAPAGFLVAPTYGALVHGLAVAEHQRHGSGDALLVDVLVQHAVDAGGAVGGKPACGGFGGCSLRCWGIGRQRRIQHRQGGEGECSDGYDRAACGARPRERTADGIEPALSQDHGSNTFGAICSGHVSADIIIASSAGAAPLWGSLVVGQLGKLRPIGNRPNVTIQQTLRR